MRHTSGTLRAALHRQMRAQIERGGKPEQIGPALGIARAHVYRVMKAAGVRKFHLTPDERQIIEARRRTFNH